MGFRTVVMLSNDAAGQWAEDPELGRKIVRASYRADKQGARELRPYGAVAECVHADVTTLAVLGNYTTFYPLATCGFHHVSVQKDAHSVLMLKQAAQKLGYKLVRHDFKR